MAWRIQQNRLRREARKDEVTVRRASTGETTTAAPAVVDLPALHRSLNEKKQAVRVLVAFARELAGTST